jgi:hypothetical protein
MYCDIAQEAVAGPAGQAALQHVSYKTASDSVRALAGSAPDKPCTALPVMVQGLCAHHCQANQYQEHDCSPIHLLPVFVLSLPFAIAGLCPGCLITCLAGVLYMRQCASCDRTGSGAAPHCCCCVQHAMSGFTCASMPRSSLLRVLPVATPVFWEAGQQQGCVPPVSCVQYPSEGSCCQRLRHVVAASQHDMSMWETALLSTQNHPGPCCSPLLVDCGGHCQRCTMMC